MSITHLNQVDAQQIDNELFNDYAFSVDQLMELAGLSCAVAIHKAYGNAELLKPANKVMVICGPGNNGGDGLVCARHLKLFGHNPSVYYPRTPSKPLYQNLIKQCELMDIPILKEFPTNDWSSQTCGLLIDAVFGFGYKPPARPEYQKILSSMSETTIPVVSIDVPSGWNVETGPDSNERHVNPDCLISLTAPKLCARYFQGRYHYLGGRFVPEALKIKYKLEIPSYPGHEPCVLINPK